ncbi:MAG: class I SAM-dependent rRNA methyltransferase [Acidobacteriota bacterium]
MQERQKRTESEKSIAEVSITRKGLERLVQGHLWIYRADLITSKIAPLPGSIVRVRGPQGQLLGKAFYSSQSQIALRLITTTDEPINRQFWHSRLVAAHQLRERVVEGAQAYRLIHGEGDLIPSLIIDRYGECFVLQMLSQATDALRTTWLELLKEMFQPRTLIERDDVRVRTLEGLPEQTAILAGQPPPKLIIDQHGVGFTVDLLGGQKTGLFLDQRENHRSARHYAHGRALDCFTFTGAFALHMAENAESVLGLDISAAAIEQAEQNATLNGLNNVHFEVANVFDRLRDFDLAKEQFDTVVLDPPAFAKNRAAIPAAIRGYKEINLRAMKLLSPGGILITCTCSFNVSEEMFLEILQAAAADAGRCLQLLEKRTQGRDHPMLLALPETYYLKCMILRVL